MRIAALRSSSSPLLTFVAAGLVFAAAAVASPAPQQAGQVTEEEGLTLVYHTDDTYELTADGVLLEALVARLAAASGAEFSVAPELLHYPVTLQTDRVALSALLEQLRASLAANLILAASAERAVSRVWLTPTSLTASVADGAAGAPATAGQPVTPGVTPQIPPPPAGVLPTPTGSETMAAGFDPSVDMAAYIRSQAAAAQPPAGTQGAVAPGTPGASGASGAPAGQPGEAGTTPPQAQNGPPIPMDPNALENYFAGDSTTNTYHRLNCIQAMYLPSVNKVWFKSRQEAIAAGYTPHEICVGR